MRKTFIQILAITDKIEKIIHENEQIKKGKYLFFSERFRWRKINQNLHKLNYYHNLKIEVLTGLEEEIKQEKLKTNSHIRITDSQIIASKSMMDNYKKNKNLKQ